MILKNVDLTFQCAVITSDYTKSRLSQFEKINIAWRRDETNLLIDADKYLRQLGENNKGTVITFLFTLYLTSVKIEISLYIHRQGSPHENSAIIVFSFKSSSDSSYKNNTLQRTEY